MLIPPVLVLVDGEDVTSQALAYNARTVLLYSADGSTRQIQCESVVRLE